MIDVALHDPLEAVAQADDVDTLQAGAYGRCPDNTVETGRRAAAA